MRTEYKNLNPQFWNWKIIQKYYFSSNQSAGVQTAASPQPQPPSGAYGNPTPGPFVSQPPSDIDRRRANLRSRMDDDLNAGQKTGPKNRYGRKNIWKFNNLIFWVRILIQKFFTMFQVILGRNRFWNALRMHTCIKSSNPIEKKKYA